MRMLILYLIVTTLGTACAQQGDSRSVVLGEQNDEQGLRVPNEGDGINEPATIAGRTGRRASAQNPYLYVDVDDEWLFDGAYDIWVTVEFCPQALSFMGVEYEAVGEEATVARRYTRCEDAALGYAVGEWMHYTFHIPNARLANGENYHTDFRLVPRQDIVIGKITVWTAKPADYEQTRVPSAEELAKHRTPIPEGFELTFGNDASPAAAALYKVLGVTSIESYVHWQSLEPDARGTWDWSEWDEQAQVLRDADLRWVPFLIAGPAYATPDWFRRSEASHVFRCLAHHQDSFVQSLWNPALFPEIDRYLAAFAQHYEPALLESVLLGVTGIYGESIYPAGPEGGWTAGRTGDYHNHMGFWCDDDLAQADFRRFLGQRYGTVAALNERWGTRYAGLDGVQPFLPQDSPGDRAYLDLRDWYMGAMTDWSERWVQAARKHFPDTGIYLCTGGDGNVMLGADFSAQTRRIAPYDAGVRITNEGSDYAHNFAITRWVASACKLYGTYYGYEPASGVDPNGVVARIYNATASGCRQLHYYSNNVTASKEATDNFRANASHLRPRTPQVDVALLLPSEHLALHQGDFSVFFQRAAELRDVVDLDFADSNMVADGCLDRAAYLLAPIGRQFEANTLRTIEEWVQSGGVLIATGDCRLSTIEGDDSVHRRLFAEPAPEVLTEACRPVLFDGEPMASFCLDVGAPWDKAYLGGRWHHSERAAEWTPEEGPTKRWSGPRALAYLPVRSSGPATLKLDVVIPGHALGPNPVRVNGVEVGALDDVSRRDWEFPVPAEAMAKAEVAVVELSCTGWRPSDHGSTDARLLGIAVRSITLTSQGAPQAQEGDLPTVGVGMEFDAASVLPQCARTLGKGATLCLPDTWDANAPTLLRAMAAAIEQPHHYLPGKPSVIALDGALDNVFWTICEESALVLNFADNEVTRGFAVREGDLRPPAAQVGKAYSVTISPRSIAEVVW